MPKHELNERQPDVGVDSLSDEELYGLIAIRAYDLYLQREREAEMQTIHTGHLDLYRNFDERTGEPLPRMNTLLIDSEQLESGEAMSADFKQIATREIEEFKADYRRRFPGRDTDALSDEDLLREVMNTVGKPGKLGEQIRCVVSVSMLT